MELRKRLDNIQCEKGEIIILWVGQAGFLIKNSDGKVLAIDLYLSDLAMKQDGNKRMVPPLILPNEVKADLVLSSHAHTDHLDVDSLPQILSDNANLYCSESGYDLCLKAGIAKENVSTVKVGDAFEEKGYKIKAVFADHGDMAPDAVGFVVETEGIRLYFTGDTSYQPMRMEKALEEGVDVLLVPINGEYGNTNENDAAMLAAQAKAKLTIPCHFWTFIRHEGNPYKFKVSMMENAPGQDAYVMAMGEILRYQKDGRWSSVDCN